MLRKTGAAFLAATLLAAVTAYFSQGLGYIFPYSAGRIIYLTERAAFLLLISFLFANVAAARKAFPAGRRALLLRGWLPLAAGTAVYTVGERLFNRVTPFPLPTASWMELFVFQFFTHILIVGFFFLLLTLLGRFWWHVPSAARPLRTAALLGLTVLAGSLLSTGLTVPLLAAWQQPSESLDRICFLNAAQSLRSMAVLYAAGLIWALPPQGGREGCDEA